MDKGCACPYLELNSGRLTGKTSDFNISATINYSRDKIYNETINNNINISINNIKYISTISAVKNVACTVDLLVFIPSYARRCHVIGCDYGLGLD
jgi:hypothetical protein